MNLLLVKISIPIIGLLAVAGAFLRWRRRELPTGLFAGWTLLWLAIAVVVQLPQQTDVFARLLGIGRGVDALMFLAVLALVLLVFRIYLRLERQEREITALVREIALLRSEKKQ
ncbi:DUF2304 domain-containing protein [Patescibacteria group bacterium]|nr:MAG: DUF2304 domain-containing protein [Patescibacteria group bacterium]